MRKLLILLTILFVTFTFADQNTKTKLTKKDKPKECKQKKYCKEIASCKEAKFYLEVCGHLNLDRDKDGIPCENVCK
ncbi:excalibur calcium-binding domain-containing protein [Aliarcobacter cryaerophilus]|uniref:excalibur calcium-binding domain-containing protein n=1 Tax=Aliarcobacter cryaerophilus TaxID=28198 RepID=UPI00316D5A48